MAESGDLQAWVGRLAREARQEDASEEARHGAAETEEEDDVEESDEEELASSSTPTWRLSPLPRRPLRDPCWTRRRRRRMTTPKKSPSTSHQASSSSSDSSTSSSSSVSAFSHPHPRSLTQALTQDEKLANVRSHSPDIHETFILG